MSVPKFWEVHPPTYEKLPSKERMDAYLRHLVSKSLERRSRHGSAFNTDRYRERLDYELWAITECKVAPYIFTARELVSWGRGNNIPVFGGGRSAGSLICWLLGITPFDPVAGGLNYEFLDMLWKSHTGIDFYLDNQGRKESLAHIKASFPTAAILANSDTETRFSVSDSADAHHAENWRYSLIAHPMLNDAREPLARLALVNPAGDYPYISAYRRKTQIGHDEPVPFAPPPLFTPPLDDTNTYALYASGELGAEYFSDKPWLSRYARWLKPTTFDDLTALFIPWEEPDFRHERLAEYIRRRLGKGVPSPTIPELEPFLQESCGLLMYQEQAAHILHGIGGSPMMKAAECIRGLHAWGVDRVIEQADFEAGARKRGYSTETVATIIDLLRKRAGFLVQKSWCATQAFISYQAVYLKAHSINLIRPEANNAHLHESFTYP